MRPMSKLFRAASVLVLGVAALGFSATHADAKSGNGRGQGHGHGHGHGCRHAYVARPVYYAPRPAYYAPRPVYYAPRPVYYAPPLVYVAPAPVVYDRHRDGIDGFIGISGPHVSIGIGF